ncbi:hypothetical protein [Brumicola pallidula]|jgi:hypothetical protein|uniref:Uncharacterized protein n=1 Tax=Brumicola pallidula DSM 14239 = ACAM 615 TaxID=1121922 RepID=K6YVD7_9ALTE|nr:hypothetical protein [Glaciecola pallidula]GAC27941.1 hypothetical protein GPAL_1062 [Glaciecola pallidula DSM 14239 = ACAM 615]
MKNKLDKTIPLTQVQQLAVFGGTPLNIAPDYVSQPLSQHRMNFTGEHGFTTIIDGRVPMPFVWNEKISKGD